MTTPYERLVTAIQAAEREGKQLNVNNLQADGTGGRKGLASKMNLMVPPDPRDPTRVLSIIAKSEGPYDLAIRILNSNPNGTDYTGYLAAFRKTRADLAAKRKARGKGPKGKSRGKGRGKKEPRKVGPAITQEAMQALLEKKLNEVVGHNFANPRDAKVLDVSKLGIDGVGAQIRPFKNPRRSARGIVLSPPGETTLPIVSNNLDSYALAVRALGTKVLKRDPQIWISQFSAAYGTQPMTKDSLRNTPISEEEMRQLLQEKLNKARQNKEWLDVSDLQPNGSRIKLVRAPASEFDPAVGENVPRREATKKWIGRAEIMSNNDERYAFAVSILDPAGGPQLAEEFRRRFGVGTHMKPPKAVEEKTIASYKGKAFPGDLRDVDVISLPWFDPATDRSKKIGTKRPVRSPAVVLQRHNYLASPSAGQVSFGGAASSSQVQIPSQFGRTSPLQLAPPTSFQAAPSGFSTSAFQR